jgi:hypothetical protein
MMYCHANAILFVAQDFLTQAKFALLAVVAPSILEALDRL